MLPIVYRTHNTSISQRAEEQEISLGRGPHSHIYIVINSRKMLIHSMVSIHKESIFKIHQLKGLLKGLKLPQEISDTNKVMSLMMIEIPSIWMTDKKSFEIVARAKVWEA